jgi:hypothetical protein
MQRETNLSKLLQEIKDSKADNPSYILSAKLADDAKALL